MANVKADPAIYPASQGESRKRRSRVWPFFGAICGASLWLLLGAFGVPQIFGIGSDAGLIPLTIAGTIAAFTRFRAVIPVLAFASLVLMFVIAYTGVATPLAMKLIRSDPLPPHADAVVALSAGVTADGHLTQQGLDRSLTAARLVADGVAPVLLFTREERKTGRYRATNADDQKMLARLGVLQHVMTTRPVKSTRDEATAVASVARYRGWKRIVVVTSPFHTRRACATFERVGLTVSCVPSDSRDVAVGRLVYPHDRVAAFGLWLYETAGTLRYRQQGWI
ncbi:MAG TPA: YdcF family protein [Gemmatimonadaceae bacterium]